jgi:hypothetical protein
MRKFVDAISRIIAVLLIVGSTFAASTTVTGIVTDTMCGKKHMIAGKNDADCTRECMKSKGTWTYGLAVGDQVYGLSGDNQKFASLAGRKVSVTGQQNGNKITVHSIAPAQ